MTSQAVLANRNGTLDGMQHQVQVHGDEGQHGPDEVSGVSTISACDGMSLHGVQGPVMEQQMNSSSWRTPKEANSSARNVVADVSALACLCSQRNGDELATMNNSCSHMEININMTEEIRYELNGDVWLVQPYAEMYLDFLDKLVDKVFVFMEDVDIKDMQVAMEKTLKDGMRQFLGLMSVERMWMCWLVTMGTLLAMSHLGQWMMGLGTSLWMNHFRRWFKRSTMPRTSSWTRTFTRLDRQRQRVRKAEFQMQLKALLFASWISCCNGMEGGQQGENAFLAQMSMLATAATNAASAAERAIGLMSSQGPSSSSGAADGGLQAATRILKNPDVYTGDDPMAFAGWKFTFCSWLSFGDPRFRKCLRSQ